MSRGALTSNEGTATLRGLIAAGSPDLMLSGLPNRRHRRHFSSDLPCCSPLIGCNELLICHLKAALFENEPLENTSDDVPETGRNALQDGLLSGLYHVFEFDSGSVLGVDCC